MNCLRMSVTIKCNHQVGSCTQVYISRPGSAAFDLKNNLAIYPYFSTETRESFQTNAYERSIILLIAQVFIKFIVCTTTKQ